MSQDILAQMLGLDMGGVDYGMAPMSQNNSTNLDTNTGGGFGSNLQGIGSIGQGLAGLLSAWTGLQGLELGKDQLNFTKSNTNRNLANQAQTTNAALRDRQQRRNSASGGDYQSIDAYMKQNRVDGAKL